jgi:hypothetical protein
MSQNSQVSIDEETKRGAEEVCVEEVRVEEKSTAKKKRGGNKVSKEEYDALKAEKDAEYDALKEMYDALKADYDALKVKYEPPPPHCSICKEDITADLHTTECGHKFHKKCLSAYFLVAQKNTCPNCRCENLNPVKKGGGGGKKGGGGGGGGENHIVIHQGGRKDPTSNADNKWRAKLSEADALFVDEARAQNLTIRWKQENVKKNVGSKPYNAYENFKGETTCEESRLKGMWLEEPYRGYGEGFMWIEKDGVWYGKDETSV